MAMTAAHLSGRRHPWLGEFVRTPIRAFGDLLAGYAAIFPYDRADAPDAARMLFGPLPADDPVRVELDKTVIDWLEQKRKAPFPRERPKIQRAIREISEAFEIVALLELPNAARDLRRRFVLWNEWVARLVISPARDARAQYWRTLALTQQLAAALDPGIDARGLEPLWHRLCRDAGGSLPKRYLDIGLLGLRRLSEADNGSEVPWLAGLAHWAQARNPSKAEFNAQWFALKALYPRSPQHWRRLVSSLLSTSIFSTAKAPAWWASDNDFRPQTSPPLISPWQSPLPSEAENLIAQFDEPFADVEVRIKALFDRHRRFVTQTGDAYHFVRACHRVGRALIERGGDDPHRRAGRAQSLAREGLSWDPYNRYLWPLWRDALVADGQLEAAELVGWEFVRRVPTNPPAYGLLASLLARQANRRGDAETLFRHTITRFPGYIYARNQLAELLIIKDQIPDAMSHVEGVSGDARNSVTYSILTRLRSYNGDQQLAMEAVKRGLVLDPMNRGLLALKALLERGQPLPLKATELEQPLPSSDTSDGHEADPALVTAIRSGRVRRLRFRLETGSDKASTTDAVAELREFLHEDPNFAYAELLAARQGIWKAQSSAPPSFAAAFEEALRVEDRAKLEQLAKSQPRLDALTLVARAVLGDENAARQVETWLRSELPKEAPALEVLRTEMRPVLQTIDGGLSARETFIRYRETIVASLHDANEVGLDEDIPLAA
jgi:hypothetical protein